MREVGKSGFHPLTLRAIKKLSSPIFYLSIWKENDVHGQSEYLCVKVILWLIFWENLKIL